MSRIGLCAAMSGPWQHHIPQSLQRGFRIRRGSNATSQVWLFEKGQQPRLEFVKKIAAADDFYSPPSLDGSVTLDDQITEYERKTFDRAFQYLKAAPQGSAVDTASAAEVVAHLTIRNDHLRRSFAEAAQELFSNARSVFCDETHVRPLLGIDNNSLPHKITEAIDGFIAERPELTNIPVPRPLIYRAAHMLLREQFNTFFLDAAPRIAMLLTRMVEEAPVFVRDGHNKMLAQGFGPTPRTELLQEFAWTVRPSGSEGFILPDCVALGLEDGKGLQPLLMSGLKETSLVLMPLSSRKMLVGMRAGAAEPSLAEFNDAAAGCSHGFFIGARQELARLVPNIGLASKTFMEEALKIIEQYKKGAHTGPLDTTADTPDNDADAVVGERHTSPPIPPRYSIHFRDCADRETAERIATEIFAITNELSQTMPLDRLDGITLAHDYKAALSELDRGASAAPLEPTNEEYCVGIAMAPTVIRDGIYKVHIVLRGHLGDYLIGDQDGDLRLALQTIVQQLERVSTSQVIDEAFPGARIEDNFEAFLYQHVDAAWRDYFSVRLGAGIYPEIGDGYCDMAAAAVRRAHRELVAARLEYRSPDDMGRLMQVAMPRVIEILRFSATVLGHFDGRGERSLETHSSFASTLEQIGLRNWFILFDGELSALWGRKGRWSSFDEFLALNRHVERIFWQHGLFPWKTDDGRVRVEVRLVTEADKLLLSA